MDISKEAGAALIAIVTGVIGLAIIAVIVSRQAQTPTVIGAFGSALSGIIGAAVSPVTGRPAASSAPSNVSASLSLPSISFGV